LQYTLCNKYDTHVTNHLQNCSRTGTT